MTMATEIRALFAIIALMVTGPGYAQQWTVEDSIHIERFASIEQDWQTQGPFVLSQNKKLIAFVTLRADPANNQTTARLRVFDVAALRVFAGSSTVDSPRPVFDREAGSTDVPAAIRAVEWASDGSLLFIQRDGKDRLMRWSKDKGVQELFAPASQITGYDQASAHTLLVMSDAPAAAVKTGNNPAFAPERIDGRWLAAVLAGSVAAPWVRPQSLVILSAGGEQTKVAGVFQYSFMLPYAPISRNADFTVLRHPMPVKWRGDCWFAAPDLAAPPQLDTIGRNRTELSILRIDSGEQQRPILGPTVGVVSDQVTSYVWEPSGKAVIVGPVFGADDRCGAGGDGLPGIFEIDSSGTATQIMTVPRRDNGFPDLVSLKLAGDGSLIVTMGERVFGPDGVEERAPGTLRFRKTAGAWERLSVPATKSVPPPAREADPPLIIRQSDDVAPAIYARARGGAERLLWDLAPHARNRDIGVTERISFRDAQGAEWSGLLTLPSKRPGGLRLPLLFQTHGSKANAFFAEGGTTSAFPGRAALARGFAVFTLIENNQVLFADAAREGDKIVAAYRAAIEMLDRRGVIDPRRVGAIGWSRTAYHVKYALAFAPDLFRAAVVADGVDYGYMQYLHGLNLLGDGNVYGMGGYNEIYGGNFWTYKEAWLARSPDFNLDQVTAPVLVQAMSSSSALLSEWEFYAGLKRLNRPTELWSYPQGAHNLTRPIERTSSQQGSLDWLDYWVNGKRSSNRASADQYTRWDALRDEVEHQIRKSAN